MLDDIRKEIQNRRKEILRCMKIYDLELMESRINQFMEDLANHLFRFDTITLDCWIQSVLNKEMIS